jgi:hypothetical protein
VDLYQFAYQLEGIVTEIVQVEGLLFLNKENLSLADLRAKVASHESTTDAQRWMNIYLFDDFITEAAGDEWTDDDPSVETIVSVFKRAWSYQIQVKYPDAKFSIERVSDSEYGDLGVRLLGTI